MCGIAGAIDLRRSARVFRISAAGDDRRDRPPRAGRRADPHRAGAGAGSAAAVDRRPGGRPPADQQRGRLDLGHAERRDLRVSRAPARAARARPSAGDAVRHRALGPPLRRPAARDVFEKTRGQFAVALWDRKTRTLDPGPRPGGDLPAVLRRGRRLAALGLGDQGAAGLGTGRRTARPQGHRPVLQHVLRRHDADVLRGDQDRSRRAIICGFATAGSSSSSTGTSIFPMPARSAGSTIRRRWSTSWNS